jgi:hypothetical protein
MSDPNTTPASTPSTIFPAQQTDPLAKGSDTSEGQNNKIIMWAGIGITVLGTLATQLQFTSPESKWTAAIVAVASMLGMVWKALGYDKTRATVKTEKLRTDAVVTAATATAAHQAQQNPPTPPFA